MKITLAAIVLCLFLAGCGNKGTKEQTSSPIQPPLAPVDKVEWKWGDLQCQKQRNCRNSVLNLDFAGLHGFLVQDFIALPKGHDENRAFYCGRAVMRSWQETFPLRDKSAEQFLLTVFDPIRCQVSHLPQTALIEFLKSTEDYKNEIKN